MSRIGFRVLTAVAAAFSFLSISTPAFSDSQVRIVRLSYIEGGVQVDRASGYEKAITNLPVAQGTKLRAADDGRAEIEFEDGSTLRITPKTEVEFPQLSLRDSGGKMSTVDVVKGTAYVNYAGAKNDEFAVVFGQEKVVLTHSAHFRIGAADSAATVAVFKGDVRITGPSGTLDVKKNQTASFDLSANDQYKVAKNIDQLTYDSWDKQQSEYHVRYASNSYNSYSPYAYGTTDLAYYGNFFNAPGYGMMWQPYFIGAGWDPFMDGAWAFSPGWGYGWVSAYPWGWTPYHYGTWVFLPGYGWAWQPGGVWMPWYAQPRVVNPPKGFGAPQAPMNGNRTVVVNRSPASAPAMQSGSKVVIRNNSAGLGIPRGEINNLAKVSHQVETHGAVTQRVQAPAAIQPAPSARSQSRIGPASERSQGMSRSSAPAPRSAPAPSSAPPPPAAPHR
jgi:hypothetical protein